MGAQPAGCLYRSGANGVLFPPCMSLCRPGVTMRKYCGWIPGMSTPSWSRRPPVCHRKPAIRAQDGCRGGRHHGIQSEGNRGFTGSRGARSDHLGRGANCPGAVSTPGSEVRRGNRGHPVADRRVSAGFPLPAGIGEPDQGCWPGQSWPSRNTSNSWSRPRSQGIFPPLTWNWPGSAWPTPSRGRTNYTEAAAAYNQATAQPAISVDLRSRCDLNSGKMYDLLNERDMAFRQYQEVLRQDGDSAQAESARKYLRSPFTAH